MTFEFEGEDAILLDLEDYQMLKRHDSLPVTHPGAMLREIIFPSLGITKTRLAAYLNLSRQHLYDILNEKQGISPATAIRLGKLCGNGPELWLRMQLAHDLAKAKKEIDVTNLPTLKVA